MPALHSILVMPGLDPGIQLSKMDCRIKSGNDK
jgi:hypothetical protein